MTYSNEEGFNGNINLKTLLRSYFHIRYEVEGQGPSLVLHHGFSENLTTWYWKGFVEALKDAYQLILFDVRGHGESDEPHHPDAYVLPDYTSDVIALLDALEIEKCLD